jgi:hypothetical protein
MVIFKFNIINISIKNNFFVFFISNLDSTLENEFSLVQYNFFVCLIIIKMCEDCCGLQMDGL